MRSHVYAGGSNRQVVSPRSIRDLEQRTQYVHQLVPDGIHEGMIRKADTWSGQVNALKLAITASAQEIVDKLGDERDRQATRLDQLDKTQQDIQSKLDRLLEQVALLEPPAKRNENGGDEEDGDKATKAT